VAREIHRARENLGMSALVQVPAPLVVAADDSLAAHAAQFLRWFRFVRERSEHTVNAYAFDLAAFLRFCDLGGLHRPADVKVRHVEAFVAWIRQTPRRTRGGTGNHSVATANRHLHALRAFFYYLQREEIVDRNPAARAFTLSGGRKLPNYLTIPEQEALLDALIPDHSPIGQRDLTIIAVMLFAGLRVSEVVNLRLDHVDLKGERLRVVQGKGAKDREVPIIPRLRGILGAYLSDGRARLLRPKQALRNKARIDAGWFFLGWTRGGAHRRFMAGEPLLTRSVYQLIAKKVSAVVGRPTHPHAMRHSFASRLRENGADLQLIQEALGHSNIRTTTIYAHLSTSKRRADIAKFLEGETTHG
jgi:site-specific recombinase XerD